MKKAIGILSIAIMALTMTATPALAGNRAENENENQKNENRENQKSERVEKNQLQKNLKDVIRWPGPGLDDNQFMLTGTIGSTTTGSVVVSVKTSANVPNLTNSLATVNVDANTKIVSHKKDSLVLADVKTGHQVVVYGAVSGTTLTAQKIQVLDFIDSSKFILTGTVGSITASSIVVTVTSSKNLPTLTNNLATVNVDANTKYRADKTGNVTLADVKVGQQVTIQGSVNGTTLTGTSVQIKLPKGKVYGEVTAKTPTSVTVKNTVTGVTQTINTDADTKVAINGEVKTVADVQVGDKGFVKFKTKLAGMFAKVINLFR